MAETAELAVKLSLIDKMSPAIKRVQGNLSRFGASVKRAAVNAGKVMAGLGTVAAVGIGAAVKSGIQSLATLESAVMSADGAIKQMGLTGKVTGTQVAAWANEIETSIGAAFDDKDITQATTTLIRFGKLAPENLKRAMVVMTDLATKTGDVSSAGTLLARALADPTKAAGKLARAGIILTKAEQKKIAALVKAGKTAKAQAIILAALEKSTKGAAEASQGPYQRAMSVLADVTEDAQRALAEGFLPVLERVADWLSKTLADKDNIQRIRDFGKALAGAFDKALTFVQGIDWKSVGDGLRVAADWAKKLFDAFMSLPPEVKGTIIALAGLNKLSGGAVGDLVSELGKGLIKGVLGITAGVVNLKAGVVNGGGAGAGAGTGAGAGGSKVGKVLAGASIAADVVAVVLTQQQISAQNSQIAADINANLQSGIKVKTPAELQTALDGVDQGIKDIKSNPLYTLVQGDALTTLQQMRDQLMREQEGRNLPTFREGERNATLPDRNSTIDKMRAQLADTINKQGAAIRNGNTQRAARLEAKADRLREKIAEAGRETVAATDKNKQAVTAKLAQIARKPTKFTANIPVNVVTSVSVSTLQKHTRYRERVVRSGGGLVAS